jgi:hypothetical protein
MSVWRLEREIEHIRIELERYEKMAFEKQDDFQRAVRRGDERQARRDRLEQLQLEEQIRLLIRELILAERKLKQAKSKEKIK